MKNPIKIFLSILVIAASFLAGSWYASRHADEGSTSAARKILHYHCPMHPQYTSDRAGECPTCGMRLVPVYAGETASGDHSGTPMPAGTVQVSPERQQLIGLRIGQVERTKGTGIIRILGRVAPDETRIYRITAALDGWIVDALANTVGSLVKKGEILSSFFSPEFLGSQQAYLYALGSLDRFKASGNETQQQLQLTQTNLQQYKNTLKNQGMSDSQIEEITTARKAVQKIHVISPTSGFILTRNVAPDLRFEKGTELYRIGDLSKVWILADLYEREGEDVRPGLNARVFTAQNPDRELQAQVSNILPQFDRETRTLKVRLEAENPGYLLRPDMFVNVEFPIHIPSSLTVPADAVVDTGLRKTVFVDRGNGFFEPRHVKAGRRFEGRVEIVEGLAEGERIVVSGTFLIDSESRMKEAAAGIITKAWKDPVCGMEVDESKAKAAGRTSRYKDEAYYFCSDYCKQEFDKDPGKYLKKQTER
jgi:Cu(I)/Ag(I) efflux system membrane fusion protein